VRFLGDPPILARHAQIAVRPPCKRESGVQVLSRAPITESDAGGRLHAVANRWMRFSGMAFGWSALRQFRVVLWEGTDLQSRSAGFDSLTARQFIQVWVAGIPAAL
jgi:hypothetical protein